MPLAFTKQSDKIGQAEAIVLLIVPAPQGWP